MNDELRRRLRAIDPMAESSATTPVTAESSRQLLEEIMSTPVKQGEEKIAVRRSGWYAAAAAVLVLAVGGVVIFTGNGEPAGPPLELALQADDSMASCIQFDVEFLRDMPLAFEGTVVSTDGETVTLDVDTWYKGGEASQVNLSAPAGMQALIGGIDFAVGGQYLITATDGTVNYCGFSGPSTPEMRAAFEEAFPTG